MRREFLAVVVAILSVDYLAFGQQPANGNLPPPEDKRIFGIIPNYRTSPSLSDYKPLTPRQKFMIATQDSFDRGTVVLAAAFAGESQLTNANRSFGQGTAGYARYFGTAYADLVIGNYMTEAIYPSILHQDPRYFRRGTSSGWSRFGYAVGQIFWTHADTSRGQFNYSEILELNSGRDLKRLLSGQSRPCRCRVEARRPNRRGYGCQRSEGVLARPRPEGLPQTSLESWQRKKRRSRL